MNCLNLFSHQSMLKATLRPRAFSTSLIINSTAFQVKPSLIANSIALTASVNFLHTFTPFLLVWWILLRLFFLKNINTLHQHIGLQHQQSLPVAFKCPNRCFEEWNTEKWFNSRRTIKNYYFGHTWKCGRSIIEYVFFARAYLSPVQSTLLIPLLTVRSPKTYIKMAVFKCVGLTVLD